MYAEYWKPMNWNSRIDRTSGKTDVEKMSERKLWPPPRKVPWPVEAIFAAVSPPVNFGRLASKSDRLVAARPSTNMATKQATPKPASAVTTRWKLRVGSTHTAAITSSTTIEAM